ncbi:penicillin-binding protein 2 [Aerococcaceae bacterium NML190073]|nr:penicillin-binding protein 2 [Aerococcaceae bacterium NML190073]
MARIRLKQKKTTKSHIPLRLNLLFLVSFLCFVALFVRLAYLQLYRGEIFTNMVQRTESTRSTSSVPRGMMYDSQGRVLVGNQPELAIRYTRDTDSKVSPTDIVNVAKELASLIDVPVQDLTERDKKDYFIVTNLDTIRGRLTREQKLLSGSEAYQAQLDAVTQEDLQFSEAELKVVALFKKMNSAFALSTVSVKNKNVTQEEIARVSEHLGSLPGISIDTDWERIYPEGEMLRSILGQVSSEQRGLPSEDAGMLLARGYAMNDRVGISYLEKQYEDVLRGTKAISNVITNTADDVVETQKVFEGAKGDNLVLTMDIEFQKKLEAIAEENLRNMSERGLNDRVYIVVTNPQTGEVLGIVGKKFEYIKATDSYNYDKIIDDSLGAINTSYGMGSSVKSAMVAIGYMNGAISLADNHIVDEPLKFQASPEKSSVFNRTGSVLIDDITALQKSSNIYMIKMAMAIGGQAEYQKDGKLTIASDTIDVLRRDFAQFGLGAPTGIDLPNESPGYSPDTNQLVSALDLSYGQFDTYTPLQLAQYASVIANGGIRYAPRLVKEIRGTDANGEIGSVKASVESKVLNIVPIDPAVLARIHEGMRQASHTADGTARYYFMNYPLTVGSKTGTAEAFYSGPIQYAANQPVTNATYIGFAPFEKPEIAISVVVPYLSEDGWGRQSTKIAHQVMNAYFSSKEPYKQAIDTYLSTFVEP